MVDAFVGTWKLVDSKNFDDYMKSIGERDSGCWAGEGLAACAVLHNVRALASTPARLLHPSCSRLGSRGTRRRGQPGLGHARPVGRGLSGLNPARGIPR